MSPLLCRAKTRERGKSCSLMPSDHLTSEKTKGARKVKHHPQRCPCCVGWAFSIHASAFQNHLRREVVSGFSSPTPSFVHLRPVQLLAVAPQAPRGFLFHHPTWHWFWLCTEHFRKADRSKDIQLSCCCVLAVDECITIHPPWSAPKHFICNEQKKKKQTTFSYCYCYLESSCFSVLDWMYLSCCPLLSEERGVCKACSKGSAPSVSLVRKSVLFFFICISWTHICVN